MEFSRLLHSRFCSIVGSFNCVEDAIERNKFYSCCTLISLQAGNFPKLDLESMICLLEAVDRISLLPLFHPNYANCPSHILDGLELLL